MLGKHGSRACHERLCGLGRRRRVAEDDSLSVGDWEGDTLAVPDMATLAGAGPPSSIPHAVARVAARGMETAFRAARLKGRPPITREALNLVGSHHRVPIDRARRDLGYQPVVGYEDGMRAVEAYLKTR